MPFFRSAPAWLVGAAVSHRRRRLLIGRIRGRLAGEGAGARSWARAFRSTFTATSIITFATNRVTGGGLLLYPSGAALTQINGGLSLDLYKNPTGFINSITVYGGVWNEFWVGGRAVRRARLAGDGLPTPASTSASRNTGS